MKKLLQLIEVSKKSDIETRELIERYAQDCVPFVFSKKGETRDIDENLEATFDAPFKVFSLEMVDPYFLCIPRENDIEKVFVSCIFCVEISPNNFDFIVLANARNIDVTFKANTLSKIDIQKIFSMMLKRLNNERIGIQNKVFKTKVGSGKSKKYIKLNKIVYVRPKKEVTEKFILENKNIDWSHKWLVRGHWRKIEGIGKNREGHYNVENFTWVKEHAKGQGELLIKQRRVI